MVLMERAALAVRDYILLPDNNISSENVLCVCGAGNNGGDGVAVARLLRLAGTDASGLFMGDLGRASAETAQQLKIAHSYGVPIFENEPALARDGGLTGIVDAIFGIGLSREVTGDNREVIDNININSERSAVSVVSIDIPSGLNADTGQAMGAAVKADHTVTLAYAKQGLYQYDGPSHSGKIYIADIGIYA
jgi:hydroxyethylthiazole kinase-like uncharacterized protein yjeF